MPRNHRFISLGALTMIMNLNFESVNWILSQRNARTLPLV